MVPGSGFLGLKLRLRGLGLFMFRVLGFRVLEAFRAFRGFRGFSGLGF